jgi:hypothetical protein
MFAGIYGRRRRDMLTVPEADKALPKVSFA